MFGGQGLYADGVMFGLVADGEIYLKVDDETKADFSAAGSRPFVYDGKGRRIEMSYWRLPEMALDDPDAVAIWARRALHAALRSKGASKKTVTKKRARPS